MADPEPVSRTPNRGELAATALQLDACTRVSRRTRPMNCPVKGRQTDMVSGRRRGRRGGQVWLESGGGTREDPNPCGGRGASRSVHLSLGSGGCLLGPWLGAC